MSFARGYRRSASFAEPPPVTRPCDHPGCTEGGVHRAPKSRALNEYWWFCLDHVREYNKSWNFYAGMTPEEIERQARADTVWNRPTWRLGAWHADKRLRERVWQTFGPGGGPGGADDPFDLRRRRGAEDRAGEARQNRRRGDPEFEWACDTLGLSEPFDLAQLKVTYKALVKRHHPDANGGSREAEEKLKTVNHAYAVLRARLPA